jgi:hypothetical protein
MDQGTDLSTLCYMKLLSGSFIGHIAEIKVVFIRELGIRVTMERIDPEENLLLGKLWLVSGRWDQFSGARIAI